jgi:hypothetical protein
MSAISVSSDRFCMDGFSNVLCLCPASRLSLATLVLSTWTHVERFVLTDRPPGNQEIAGYDAVVLMDSFVTREIATRLAARLPIFVIAWNGYFEIVRQREALGTVDVTFMGTDETLTLLGVSAYLPIINPGCAFSEWRHLYATKSRFAASGSTSYRARWLRTKLLSHRAVNVLVSTAGGLPRLDVVRRTLQSAAVKNKLVWAGNVALNMSELGLEPDEQAFLERGIAAARAKQDPHDRLRTSLGLMDEWQAFVARRSNPELNAFYITNTLLRWSALAYLKVVAPSATWFFGADNLGLGLELELYVHNLVPSSRIVFLELGGKSSESELYPRALHLLSREVYVLPVPQDTAASALATIERIGRRVSTRPQELFEDLERRRQHLYATLRPDCTLREAQQRVWNDFRESEPLARDR